LGGTNTFAQNSGNGFIAPNAGHSSSLSTLPTALGSGIYEVQANLFSELTTGALGYQQIGFYHVNQGQYLWQPGTIDLALSVDANGGWSVGGSSAGLGAVVQDIGPTGQVSTAGWSSTSAPVADLVWDTVNNTVSASLNGVALFSNYSLSSTQIHASDVNFVGFGRDQALGANSLVDNFQFSTVTTVPVPGAIWLFGSGLVGLLSFTRRTYQNS
jgi:hypothetical protein